MQPQPHLPAIRSRLIAETADTIAVYQPAGRLGPDAPGPLVITFPHLTTRISGLRFWGDQMLARAGVAAIGLVSRQPHWYIRAEIERLLPALMPLVARHKPARIVTLGYSMGATPALMHAGRLGADLAAAFSPHYSIDPALIGKFDTRPKRTFDRAQHRGFRVLATDLAPLSVLFYDPLHRWDREHARRIEALSARVRRVLVTGAGHFSITPILASEAASDAFVSLLLEATAETFVQSARNLVRGARNATPDYHQELSAHLMQRGRPVLALRSAARAAALQPQNARRQIHLRDLRQRAAGAAVASPPP